MNRSIKPHRRGNPPPNTRALIPVVSPSSEADSDAALIALWLHGKSPHTQRAYRRDLARFLAFCERPIRAVSLGDLQGFQDQLSKLSPASSARSVAAVKSLLAFALSIGYSERDAGAALRRPRVRSRLAERILLEEDVMRMIEFEPHRRNRPMLLFLYATGIRVSELCSLSWRDLQPRDDTGAGQVTVFGKGGKERAVQVSQRTWDAVQALRGKAGPEDPVFRSRCGGRLTPSGVGRLVRKAAERAGIKGNVSPHWLRHSTATHAIAAGCPLHVIQQALGHSSIATTGMYLHAMPLESPASYLKGV